MYIFVFFIFDVSLVTCRIYPVEPTCVGKHIWFFVNGSYFNNRRNVISSSRFIKFGDNVPLVIAFNMNILAITYAPYAIESICGIENTIILCSSNSFILRQSENLIVQLSHVSLHN